MAVTDISLSPGMRSSLNSLQANSQRLQRTQQRLASGKAVNSALDNVTNFFTAASHVNRRNDLISRKDGISEGIQAIKAAENGITAISALLDSMKAVANQASTTSDQADRDAFSKTYIGLRRQVTFLADDSRYGGTNLLNNDNLTLDFGEHSGVSTQVIVGFDASAEGLGLGNKVAAGTGGLVAQQTATFSVPSPLAANTPFTADYVIGDVSQTTINDTLQISFTNSAPPTLNAGESFSSPPVILNGTLNVSGSVSQNVPVSMPQTVPAPNPSPPPATINTIVNVPTYANVSWGGNQERSFQTWSNPGNVLEVQLDGVRQENNYSISSSGIIVFDSSAAPATGQAVTFIRTDTWDSSGSATASIKQLDTAQETLKAKSNYLASTLNIATTRLDFNDQMANILATGADNLTLANMSQESAGMLMLQTRQDLGVTSLRLASQSQQDVLRMF